MEDPNDRRYYWWRLLTKQRLFKRSKDMLIQLDMSDRLMKLDQTVDFVEEGYEELLKKFAALEEVLKEREVEATELAESAPTVVPSENGENANGMIGRDQRTKRKFTAEDDEDEDGEEEGVAAKRAKA